MSRTLRSSRMIGKENDSAIPRPSKTPSSRGRLQNATNRPVTRSMTKTTTSQSDNAGTKTKVSRKSVRRGPPDWAKIHAKEEQRKQQRLAQSKRPSTRTQEFKFSQLSSRRNHQDDELVVDKEVESKGSKIRNHGPSKENQRATTNFAQPLRDDFEEDSAAFDSIMSGQGVNVAKLGAPVSTKRFTVSGSVHQEQLEQASKTIMDLRQKRASMFVRSQPTLGRVSTFRPRVMTNSNINNNNNQRLGNEPSQRFTEQTQSSANGPSTPVRTDFSERLALAQASAKKLASARLTNRRIQQQGALLQRNLSAPAVTGNQHLIGNEEFHSSSDAFDSIMNERGIDDNMIANSQKPSRQTIAACSGQSTSTKRGSLYFGPMRVLSKTTKQNNTDWARTISTPNKRPDDESNIPGSAMKRSHSVVLSTTPARRVIPGVKNSSTSYLGGHKKRLFQGEAANDNLTKIDSELARLEQIREQELALERELELAEKQLQQEAVQKEMEHQDKLRQETQQLQLNQQQHQVVQMELEQNARIRESVQQQRQMVAPKAIRVPAVTLSTAENSKDYTPTFTDVDEYSAELAGYERLARLRDEPAGISDTQRFRDECCRNPILESSLFQTLSDNEGDEEDDAASDPLPGAPTHTFRPIGSKPSTLSSPSCSTPNAKLSPSGSRQQAMHPTGLVGKVVSIGGAFQSIG